MLQEVFYWVFNMSITAGITGGVVLLIRRIRRIPKRITVFLWLIPFFRMIVPIGLNSPYSLMSLLSRITTKTVIVYQPADAISFSMMNSVMAADSYFPITYKADLLDRIFQIASTIWIVVSLTIILAIAVIYYTTLHDMKDAHILHDNIYLSEKMVYPAVYGILRPKIILPESYAEQDIAYVLLHEEMHIHRGDNLWRMIAILIVAVHWFNPLSWVFLKQFLADLELSCDECVLAKHNDIHRKDYALSLLKSKESTKVLVSAFGGAKIRTRIENILSFRRMTWLSVTGFLALLTAIFYVLLTNAG